MQNLDELLATPAQEWNDETILQLISSLRDQRERWGQEQKEGSRKRVTAAKVEVKPAKRDLALAALDTDSELDSTRDNGKKTPLSTAESSLRGMLHQ